MALFSQLHWQRSSAMQNRYTNEEPFLTRPNQQRIDHDLPLLPDSTLVESQLLTLQNVSIAATTLAGSRRDKGV